jgi:hypothetical protein
MVIVADNVLWGRNYSLLIPHPGIEFDRVNIERWPSPCRYPELGDVFSYAYLVRTPPTTHEGHVFTEMEVATFVPWSIRLWGDNGWRIHNPPRLYGSHIPRDYAAANLIATAPSNFSI